MKRRKRASGLAAAFVVTIAGCGGEPTITRNPPEPTIHRNPPAPEPEPTTTSTFATPADPTGAPTGAPTSAPTAGLPEAPQGWNVRPNGDGTCTAYGPDPCNHPGCNPPPPRKVVCPPDMAQTTPK